MRIRLTVVGVFAVSAMAVGCGGMPEEAQQGTVNAVERQDVGNIEQGIEYKRLDAQQTGDFSTWLGGDTPWRIYNANAEAIPFAAWCGSHHFTASVPAGGMHEGKLPCGWPGARLYIKNEGYTSGLFLDAYTY